MGWMDGWMGFLGSTGLRNHQGGPGPGTGKKKDRLPKSSKKILMVQSWSFASAAQNQNPPIWGEDDGEGHGKKHTYILRAFYASLHRKRI